MHLIQLNPGRTGYKGSLLYNCCTCNLDLERLPWVLATITFRHMRNGSPWNKRTPPGSLYCALLKILYYKMYCSLYVLSCIFLMPLIHGTSIRWYCKIPCAHMYPPSWNPSMSEKLSENLFGWSNDREIGSNDSQLLSTYIYYNSK